MDYTHTKPPIITEHKVNGIRHCIDGPAVIYSNGDSEWWFEGKRHRENDHFSFRKMMVQH